MDIYKTYEKRFAFQAAKLHYKVSSKLELIVVIPAYNEISLIKSVESVLANLYSKAKYEIIVVFNAAENDVEGQEVNRFAEQELNTFIEQNKLTENVFTLNELLPKKHAGVGLARKIGMDEASARFNSIQNLKGVIVCFDADSLCQTNYLQSIEDFFSQNEKIAAASIHFEHPLSGTEFSEEIYFGILHYELHLRYYKQGLAFANLPFAYHSIGSSMAVRAKDYLKQGGMNRRMAGEDFYFLQKFIDIGLLGEINSTTVIPSPRKSDRVPFGTGRAIKEMLEEKRKIEYSYAFEVFKTLKNCFANVNTWYHKADEIDSKLIEFVGKEEFFRKIEEIKSNASSQDVFLNRFFQWFNAFQALKFVHFLRDNYYPNKSLKTEVPKLLNRFEGSDVKTMLLELRRLDQSS